MIVDAASLALQTEDLRTTYFSRFYRVMVERWTGNPAKTVELTEQLVDNLRATSNLTSLGSIIFARALALAEVGRTEEGIALVKDAIDISEKLGGESMLGRFYNCLGYCYSEIHHTRAAWELNLRSEELGRSLMGQFPMDRQIHAEVVAQANVNLMENLFDQGEHDEARKRILSFDHESKSEDFDKLRVLWEARMQYLASQILLERNKVDEAEVLVKNNLERAKREHMKKNEGRFLRLMGEIQTRRNEAENAIKSLRTAILLLQEVGNKRQLWQAHASFASALDTFGRSGEAREQWGTAGEVIHNTANGLSDRQLREGFLSAKPIREILAKTET
jgi:tetratricopeptide (TPR) repeat protein